jgi:hypothetical protein
MLLSFWNLSTMSLCLPPWSKATNLIPLAVKADITTGAQLEASTGELTVETVVPVREDHMSGCRSANGMVHWSVLTIRVARAVVQEVLDQEIDLT